MHQTSPVLGGELAGVLQVAQGVGDGVRAGQADQPVPGPRVRARLDDPVASLDERPQYQPVAEQLDRHQPRGAYAVLPGHRGDPAVPQRAALVEQAPHRAVEDEPGRGRDPPRPQLPAIARQRSVVSPTTSKA